MRKTLFLFLVLAFLPLFFVFTFHLRLERQPFGGRLLKIEDCANGKYLEIESYHQRSYFQPIEKVVKSFMFSEDPNMKPETGENKSAGIKSLYLTPSKPIETNVIFIGTAKPEGSCLEKKTRIVTSTLPGSTTTVTSTEEYIAVRKDSDYTVIIMGRVLPCSLTHLKNILSFCP